MSTEAVCDRDSYTRRMSEVLVEDDEPQAQATRTRNKPKPQAPKKMSRPKGFICTDQIILIPEIMSLILDKLDFQSLKTVRLVCHSWLREAQFHMERRGVVRFKHILTCTKIREFAKMREEQQLSSDLPQPFQSIELDLSRSYACISADAHRVAEELSRICPPLALTRFAPGLMHLSLTLPRITHFSSSLEYLRLGGATCGAECLDLLDPEVQFPKLKHLDVGAHSSLESNPNATTIRSHFPSIVAWIVRASPQLEIYDALCISDVELATLLLMQVHTKTVKTLKLALSPTTDRLALKPYLLPLAFSQVQHLQVNYETTGDDHPSEGLRLLALIVTHCAQSLRTLILPNETFQEGLEVAFPICPNLQELALHGIVYPSDFIPRHFPALEELNVRRVQLVEVYEDCWRSLSPFLSVKTLRLQKLTGLRKKYFGPSRDIPEAVQFFEKFPNLERLLIQPLMLKQCCGLRVSAGDDGRFSTLLAGLKHVELDCEYRVYASDSTWLSDASSLAILKGVETLTMLTFNIGIAAGAVKELRNLKMLQFPWGSTFSKDICPHMPTLQEVARGVEKLVVSTNWNPSSRFLDSPSKKILEEFLELAPNVLCREG